jgi:UDP-N-acetylmuramoyl-L-alanyl-D-glutamate--2,6-diaminopimelate ligase
MQPSELSEVYNPSPKRFRPADHRAVGRALLLQRSVDGGRCMKLKTLLAGIEVIDHTGPSKLEVTCLATDSRRVTPGCLFLALPGLRTHGLKHVPEAIDRGAAVILCEEPCWAPAKVGVVQVQNLRQLLPEIAARFFGHPGKELELTGILGTSGKTVVANLLQHLRGNAQWSGLIGTISYNVGHRSLPAQRTTPEPVELHGLLRRIRESGQDHALLEISGHGLKQDRVRGLEFRQLILTNLTPEHLDYHGSLASAIASVETFITEQAPFLKNLIAGIDDPEVAALVARLPQPIRDKVITFGLDAAADVRAQAIEAGRVDTRFTLVMGDEEGPRLVSPLVGDFNLQNLLGAIACGQADGLSTASMGASLIEFKGVAGRMEAVREAGEFSLLVDYMHTEASYRKGLQMLRQRTKGRLLTVFGCGGDRDRSIRPKLARLVAELSDLAIATSDNPRSEAIESIFEDMQEGNEHLSQLHFIGDRRQAIARAIEVAEPGDTVLIAGKGHETFQEFKDCVVPFDDRAVAREILENRTWRERE